MLGVLWLGCGKVALVVTHAMLRRLTSWRCIIIIKVIPSVTGYVIPDVLFNSRPYYCWAGAVVCALLNALLVRFMT